jgi:hypothetical protein
LWCLVAAAMGNSYSTFFSLTRQCEIDTKVFVSIYISARSVWEFYCLTFLSTFETFTSYPHSCS